LANALLPIVDTLFAANGANRPVHIVVDIGAGILNLDTYFFSSENIGKKIMLDHQQASDKLLKQNL